MTGRKFIYLFYSSTEIETNKNPCFLDNRKCFFFDIETLPLRVKNCGILELRNQWQRIYLQDTLFRQMNLKYISSYKPVRFRQKGRKILL